MKNLKTCKKCILNEEYPGISFNEQDICNFCTNEAAEAQKDWNMQKKLLEKKIEEIRNEASNYHAIVPWSGGKDSTYVIYVLQKIYGLKVLAINFDNGFKSSFAYKNIKNISKKIGFDLVTLKPNPKLMNRLYKHYLQIKGELCSVCNIVRYVMIFSYIFREQASLGYMPLFVDGMLKKNSENNSYFTYDYAEFKKVISQDPELLKDFENNILVNKNVCTMMESTGDSRILGSQLDRVTGDKFFHLSEYVKWNGKIIKEILKKEYSWAASDSPITVHEDCKWHNSMNYLLLKKYGIDNDIFALAREVRNKNLSRDKALETVNILKDHEEPSEMQQLLKDIGCNFDQVNLKSDEESNKLAKV